MDPNATDSVTTVTSLSTLWTSIVASGGVIIGFLFAKLYDLVSQKLTEPKLEVEFDENIPGCIAHTAPNNELSVRFIRMRVTNRGKRVATARGCVAYLTNVEWQNENGEFEPTDYCESIRLAWSCQGLRPERFGSMDIPRGVNQYIDIVAFREKHANFEPQLEVTPIRYLVLFQTIGTKLFTVHVHAENASPVKCKLIFTWPVEDEDTSAFEALSYKD